MFVLESKEIWPIQVSRYYWSTIKSQAIFQLHPIQTELVELNVIRISYLDYISHFS